MMSGTCPLPPSAQTIEPAFQICDTQTVLNRIPFANLKELVYEPLADDVICLDMEEPSKERPSDDQVMMLIKEMTGATSSSVFQQLPDDIKRVTLKELKNKRVSLRQLERLTGTFRLRYEQRMLACYAMP